jgi:hypothetical protein
MLASRRACRDFSADGLRSVGGAGRVTRKEDRAVEAIPILALLIPIVIVPTALGLRLARQHREMEHKERIKALELGRTLPQDEPWCTPARISLVIAAGVPVGAFGFACMATAAAGFQEDIWMSAMSVSVVSVISGSILAAKHFAQRAQAEARVQAEDAKLAVDDADAYDVVGRRG